MEKDIKSPVRVNSRTGGEVRMKVTARGDPHNKTRQQPRNRTSSMGDGQEIKGSRGMRMEAYEARKEAR